MPARTDPPRTRENTVRAEPPMVPFVIQREGEDAAPDNLLLSSLGPDRYRLHYADEDPGTVTCAACCGPAAPSGTVDDLGRPVGRPQWRMMQALRCQVCAERARTPLGFIFLAGPDTVDPDDRTVLTNQPPVCPEHARMSADLCPHLTPDPMAFLVQSAPMYGVNGVGYGYGDQGVQVVQRPAGPIPYSHPLLPTVLASQMVRRLSAFRLVGLNQLLWELERAA
ncbi:hypothetical protein ABZ759_32795 [Streptomyces sp. NPDC047860]|uniref:hypothetical protein n=1 Tax=Streptomyces sp. NPDC047860 TaxID=3155743 RepID=UPI0033E37B79